MGQAGASRPLERAPQLLDRTAEAWGLRSALTKLMNLSLGSHTNVLSERAGSVQLCTSELGVIFPALSPMDGAIGLECSEFEPGYYS